MQLYAFPKGDGLPWSSHHTSSAVLLVMCGTHPGLAFWMHETRPSVCTHERPRYSNTALSLTPEHWRCISPKGGNCQVGSSPGSVYSTRLLWQWQNQMLWKKVGGKKNPWVLQAEQCPQIWEVWARPSFALLSAFSYPSSWFSALSNINVCVFHDCETAFLGVVSLL